MNNMPGEGIRGEAIVKQFNARMDAIKVRVDQLKQRMGAAVAKTPTTPKRLN